MFPTSRVPLSALKMVDFPGISPAGFFLSLLLQVCTWSLVVSEFSVKGPAQPITVLLGADATLPCQLSPEQSAARMHIRWYRTQLSPAVLVYQAGQEQKGEQMLEYRGRTELVGTSIDKGDVSLLIQHIRASDDGQYRCHFKDGHVSQEAIVQLNVIGLGAAPLVRMTGPEDNGIRVLCSSGGWFPKPRVLWSNKVGGKLESLSESHTQDGDGLFNVEASLIVTDSSMNNVTCSVQNPLSGQERASAIFLPEPFFPRMCPWKAATLGTVPVLVLLLVGVSYTGWRKHQAKEHAIKKREKESEERDQMKSEKELAIQARDGVKAELDRRKKLYDLDWKKALIYPDWRKEHFTLVKFTLNQELCHQNNSDPEGKDNSREETPASSLSSKQGDSNLIRLNQEEITSGRFYWEVDVKDADEWTVGVYEDSTKRSGASEDAQKKKFRVLKKKGTNYKVLSYCPQNGSHEESVDVENTPHKIVVFLDYEDSDISFYNMADAVADSGHIFSFPKDTFSGSLYPYFIRKSMELSQTAKYVN